MSAATSLHILRTTPVAALTAEQLVGHQRNVAEMFAQKFSAFAVEICGCSDPSDRVKLKKSVWHQTIGLRLRPAIPVLEKSHLKLLAGMECPVQLEPSTTSPSKIILAGKILRAHFGVSESTVCRGCSKRGRCPFAHKPVVNRTAKTSLGAVTKVLYGVAQNCMFFLRDPKKYPLIVSGDEMHAAIELVANMETFLRPTAVERQLSQVPLADKNAIKAIVKKQLAKKKSEDAKKPKIAKTPNFDIDSPDWVSEEGGVTLKPGFAPRPSPVVTKCIDSLKDIPIMHREIPDHVLLPRTASSPKRIMFKVSKILAAEKSTDTSPQGGYSVGTVASPGIEYIKPQFVLGRTVLDNVDVAGKLWNASKYVSELKFLTRVPYSDGLPEDVKRNDKTFNAALNKQANRKLLEEDVVSEVKLDTERSSGNGGVARSTLAATPRVVPLLDPKLDNNISSSSPIAWSEVKSVPCVATTSLADRVVKPVKSNLTALEAARSVLKQAPDESKKLETKSGIRFPRLPEWEPVSIGNVYKNTEFGHLMRPVGEPKNMTVPPEINPKSEHARSRKALKKAVSKLPLVQ